MILWTKTLHQKHGVMLLFLLLSYFGLLIGVPGEGNGVIGNLLDVANGVKALLVVSCNNKQEFSD